MKDSVLEYFDLREFVVISGSGIVVFALTAAVLFLIRKFTGFEFSQPVKAVFMVPFFMSIALLCTKLLPIYSWFGL